MLRRLMRRPNVVEMAAMEIHRGAPCGSHRFADPIAIFSHVRRFSQPSEVNEPIELLRAGVVFHVRGLVNGRVIHHNLGWML
jgi:hypothetical protein